MKTAMQELISQMHELTWKLMTYEQKIEVFNIFLEKEKDQIKDAYAKKWYDDIGYDWEYRHEAEEIYKTAEEYYNQTYNKNK